ncbi:MAG: S-DNA-T family DNA segregation ATPase FtsK/SpoIIIE [Gammaproteobacteria bacterium]|jgi:S-DNA-T family DNA segregation ATPase FtsK/SpoIIIE
MAQASRENPGFIAILQGPLARGSREAALILAGALTLYLLLSLGSYQAADPGWSHSGPVERVANLGGVVGAWLADVFLYLFGYLAYLFPIMIGYAGWLMYRGWRHEQTIDIYHWIIRIGGFALTLATGCGLATLHFNGGALPLDAGGVLGNVVGANLAIALSALGSTLFMLALFLTGATLFTGVSWLHVMDLTGRYTLRLVSFAIGYWDQARDGWQGHRAKRERAVQIVQVLEKKSTRTPPRIEPVITKIEPSVRAKKERQTPLFDTPPTPGELPPLHLLDPADEHHATVSEAALEAMSRLVELKLADFGVEAEVVEVHPGPVITRYELKLAPGLKVSKVTNLAKDLARSLSTMSVRIVDVIPGKPTIGLEIPNEERELVRLSEILNSNAYDEEPSPVALALGKDIAGAPVVVDLSRMPHLLVAGTTGSGKSVAINAMILSLLYKSSAEDVRMIMIDPKMLELSVYEGIPHLLAPVVTDMKHASNALRWCVAEMDRRYKLMSALGVRNIGGYNRKVKEAQAKGTPITDPLFKPPPYAEDQTAEQAPELKKLPTIVVVVDELADLMMVTGKKVEELIARLAQKARAAGIHLVLATQRPSVDVITGLIKANVPSRIAFQVSSRIDSRTILDQMGAEQLLGHGDMLYMGVGSSTTDRVHGAFVDDHEVHAVVEFLRLQGEPNYEEGILDGSALIDSDAGSGAPPAPGEGAEDDPLYDQAVQIVTETRRASISGVQRRLKIGYNRAARMLEQMESSGVVGPLQSNGGREVIAPPPPPRD